MLAKLEACLGHHMCHSISRTTAGWQLHRRGKQEIINITALDSDVVWVDASQNMSRVRGSKNQNAPTISAQLPFVPLPHWALPCGVWSDATPGVSFQHFAWWDPHTSSTIWFGREYVFIICVFGCRHCSALRHWMRANEWRCCHGYHYSAVPTVCTCVEIRLRWLMMLTSLCCELLANR